MDNQKHDVQDQKNEILTDVETYAKAECELARLKVVDQTSRLVGGLLLAICLILIAFAVLAFCAAAAVVALAQCVPTWAACLIVGGLYLLLIPLMIACSRVLFVDPIIRKLSGLKNSEELKFETLRAEGQVGVQRERLNGHVRVVQVIYNQYVQLAKSIWNTIRGLFSK